MGNSARELMLLSNQDVYSMDKDGFDEFTFKLTSFKKDLNFSWIYHCDGLMLCQTRQISRLVVWNPCTGQTRLIKPKTCYRKDDSSYTLGYNTSHSYKVLSYNWYYKNEQKFADCEIYELSSDSWRVLGSSFPLDHHLNYSGVSFSGDTYWIAGGNETGCFLMKFDFTRETFVRLPLPSQILDPLDCRAAALSVVNDEKLSVLHPSTLAGSYVMRIWVSNKVVVVGEKAKDLSWRSHFVLKMDIDRFHIPSVVNLANFVLDEENQVVIFSDLRSVKLYDYRTRIYIVGDGMFKQVYNGTVKPSRCTWPCIITYVPSLVHIHKCTPKRSKKKGRLVISS